MVDPRDAFPFDIGDLVEKVSGYSFPGTVVGRFITLTGQPRVVVEMDVHHVLHIFAPEQLRKRLN